MFISLCVYLLISLCVFADLSLCVYFVDLCVCWYFRGCMEQFS